MKQMIFGELSIDEWCALHVLVNSHLCDPQMKNLPATDSHKSEMFGLSEKLENIIWNTPESPQQNKP